MLDAVKQEIRDQVTQSVAQAMPAQPVAPLTGFAAFTQSGIFFILLGLALLLVAYWGLGIVHTTFSFVLVVLGVAILLYGTGTQGMGRVERASDQAKYNIALAGGAGVLSFCIAYGIALLGEMQRAFQIERKIRARRDQAQSRRQFELAAIGPSFRSMAYRSPR
jgi:membrane protein implicated in regulation of membrane protease activity